MLSFPILFPRKRRDGRKAQKAAPAPPPPASVTVVWALKSGEVFVDFAFSEPVTTDGGGSEFVVVHAVDGPYEALSSTQIADNVVRFEFNGSALSVGNPWEILSPPACLDFHGATLEVPQEGEVG